MEVLVDGVGVDEERAVEVEVEGASSCVGRRDEGVLRPNGLGWSQLM